MHPSEIARLRAELKSYPDIVRGEIDGLTWEQMCYAAQEPAWARWCIDLQIRHIALVTPVWLSLRAEEVLRREGYRFPETAAAIKGLIASGQRHVPPEIAPARAGVIAFMRPWADLCCEIIDREGAEGLEKRTFTFYTDPDWVRPGDPKKPVEYHRIAARLHPDGFREDAEKPGLFHFHIGAILRHIWWNVLAHLRTAQRLKMLQGLPVVHDLPREGYLTLPEFYA
ncbi:MAG: hypothetical protein HYZ11_05210 [Candidatus Tectomicrobia bacterium]|uniref:Uncharacterized protein n=1 Tax=Tectimicrobiota bacterium TaxID=2528274 RepID=A0A932MPB3_UNCTE|nr:hypothetical protein [Candidatus Tectomicrobia bacterium]